MKVKKYSKKAVIAANKKKAANKLIGKYLRAGNSMAKKDRAQFAKPLTQKAFKTRFKQYVDVTPELANKRLKTQLQSFLDYSIALWTPEQCRHARLNIKKHFNAVIRKVNNKVTLDAEDEKYLAVLKNGGYLEKLPVGDYRLNLDKFPSYDDFHTVTAKYYKLKRLVQDQFGWEYGEAFGS